MEVKVITDAEAEQVLPFQFRPFSLQFSLAN